MTEVVAATRSGEGPRKSNLAPGIVRHAMLALKVDRDTFSAAADTLEVSQADLFGVLVDLLRNEDTYKQIAAAAKIRPPTTLMISDKKQLRDALKKVSAEKLAEFLKTQGAL